MIISIERCVHFECSRERDHDTRFTLTLCTTCTYYIYIYFFDIEYRLIGVRCSEHAFKHNRELRTLLFNMYIVLYTHFIYVYIYFDFYSMILAVHAHMYNCTYKEEEKVM